MKPTIHYLPIEPIPARYTEQMLSWVYQDLQSLLEDGAIGGFRVYTPTVDASVINTGQFLDNYGSLRYKQQQLSLVLNAMEAQVVKSGDIILVGDVWYPGLESLRMASELAGVSIKIAGWHYAGVYDPHDYYSKTLGPWSRQFEGMIVSGLLDAVCCGSEFHKGLICRNISIDPNKVLPFGLVWKPSEVRDSYSCEKRKIVVFSHRLAPEKAPEHFIYAAQALRKHGMAHWRFVFSLTRKPPVELVALNDSLGNPCEFIVHESTADRSAKSSYYQLLASASIVYSAGYQETFGYSVHEGIALGCVPCLPNRACYPETVNYDARYLYDPASDPWGATKLYDLMDSLNEDGYHLTHRYASSSMNFLNHLLL